MSSIPPPYTRTTIRGGHTLDELTNYALYAMEYELGYTRGSLTVVQGSYNAGGVAQSAGTHDGGGAVDLTHDNWEKKLPAGKKVGFAIWERPENWDGRGGGAHCHLELIGNAKLSISAQAQVAQFLVGLNGLADHAKDAHPARVKPQPVFQMPARPVPKRRVFHVHGRTPYRVEDSFRGVKLAKAQRFKWIDLDCHVTADDVLVITHWPEPRHEGFRSVGDVRLNAEGLNHRIENGAKIEELTWEEVETLRTPDHYRIWRADDLVPIALSRGLNVELELKTTAIKRKHLTALRSKLGTHQDRVQVKALPQFYPALEGAWLAGYRTIILGRGRRIPANAQPYLTYRRGPVNWS